MGVKQRRPARCYVAGRRPRPCGAPHAHPIHCARDVPRRPRRLWGQPGPALRLHQLCRCHHAAGAVPGAAADPLDTAGHAAGAAGGFPKADDALIRCESAWGSGRRSAPGSLTNIPQNQFGGVCTADGSQSSISIHSQGKFNDLAIPIGVGTPCPFTSKDRRSASKCQGNDQISPSIAVPNCPR